MHRNLCQGPEQRGAESITEDSTADKGHQDCELRPVNWKNCWGRKMKMMKNRRRRRSKRSRAEEEEETKWPRKVGILFNEF